MTGPPHTQQLSRLKHTYLCCHIQGNHGIQLLLFISCKQVLTALNCRQYHQRHIPMYDTYYRQLGVPKGLQITYFNLLLLFPSRGPSRSISNRCPRIQTITPSWDSTRNSDSSRSAKTTVPTQLKPKQKFSLGSGTILVFKYGPNLAYLCFFLLLSQYNSKYCTKFGYIKVSVDGIRTLDRRMVGADESTELWLSIVFF